MTGRNASMTRTRTAMAPASASPNSQCCRALFTCGILPRLGYLVTHASMWVMAHDASFAADEEPVLLLHPHWKVLARPVLVAILVVIAALVIVVIIPSGRAAGVERLVVAAVAILALMLSLIAPVLRWRTTSYELTTR